jgi:hypothetical protein
VWEVVLLYSALTGVHELCEWLWQGRGVCEAYMCIGMGVIVVFVYAVGLGIVVHV